MKVMLAEKLHGNQEYLVYINNELLMKNDFSFIKELEQLMIALEVEISENTFHIDSLNSIPTNEKVDFKVCSSANEVVINVVPSKIIYTKENSVEYSNQVFINNEKVGEDIHLEAIKKTLDYLGISYEVDGEIAFLEVIK